MHTKNGPSLSLGRKLHWNIQSQVFYAISPLRYSKNVKKQVGLTMTWVTLCIDWHFDWKFVSTFRDQEIAVYLMVIVTIASIILSLSIGSLFIAQVYGLKNNLTTLETFIPLIELNVLFRSLSHPSTKATGRPTSMRFSGQTYGFCLQNLIFHILNTESLQLIE